MANSQTKSRWYVYELIDPRDKSVFYVGKGTGKRMFAHEQEALKGVCSKKTKKINDIKSVGLEIEKRQVAFFWDEQAAYDFETDHIEYYGLETLTNVLPGGQKAWERRQVERESRRKAKSFSPADTVVKIAGHVAWWMIHTKAGARKLKATFSGEYANLSRVRSELFDFACNEFMPELLKKATSTEEDRQRIANALRPYGVDLTYRPI